MEGLAVEKFRDPLSWGNSPTSIPAPSIRSINRLSQLTRPILLLRYTLCPPYTLTIHSPSEIRSRFLKTTRTNGYILIRWRGRVEESGLHLFGPSLSTHCS